MHKHAHTSHVARACARTYTHTLCIIYYYLYIFILYTFTFKKVEHFLLFSNFFVSGHLLKLFDITTSSIRI